MRTPAARPGNTMPYYGKPWKTIGICVFWHIEYGAFCCVPLRHMGNLTVIGKPCKPIEIGISYSPRWLGRRGDLSRWSRRRQGSCGDGAAVGVRATGSLAAAQAVEPLLERRIGVAAVRIARLRKLHSCDRYEGDQTKRQKHARPAAATANQGSGIVIPACQAAASFQPVCHVCCSSTHRPVQPELCISRASSIRAHGPLSSRRHTAWQEPRVHGLSGNPGINLPHCTRLLALA